MANDFTVKTIVSKGREYWRARITTRLTGKGRVQKRDFSSPADATQWAKEEVERLKNLGRRTLEVPAKLQDEWHRFVTRALFEKGLSQTHIIVLLNEVLERSEPCRDNEPLWSYYPDFRKRRNWSDATLARGAARAFEKDLRPFLEREKLGAFSSLEQAIRIITTELDSWVAEYARKTGESPAHRTFENRRNALGSFFAYLEKRNLVPRHLPTRLREIDSRDLTSKIKKPTGEAIHVLPPASIEKLLRRSPDFHLAHFLVLKTFCGMRDNEAANLPWECIGEDHVFVPAEISKIGKARRIEFDDVPNLKEWLAFAESHGRPKRKTIGGARARREGHWLGLVGSLRKELGLSDGQTWGEKYPNGLRDSFCSYGFLILGLEMTQKICGHHLGSNTTFRRYISSNVTTADARAFFALQPPPLKHS